MPNGSNVPTPKVQWLKTFGRSITSRGKNYSERTEVEVTFGHCFVGRRAEFLIAKG